MQILLATCNSSRFLREQLDSLMAQDWQDFTVLIRDGGSRDATPEIIREYQSRYPDRINFLGSRPAGVVENFSALLAASDADLVMFCDHDDVWLPQKISRTLARYREMEMEYGARTPIMVFTDSYAARSDLRIVDPSTLHYQHLAPKHLTLNRLILQNVPSGNTMLLNRALRDLASPIPPEAVMHDHWITLTAAVFGRIGFLDEPTLYYRQHHANFYGAFGYSPLSFLRKIRGGRDKIRRRFEQNIRQAVAFLDRYDGMLAPRDREMLAALRDWSGAGFVRRRTILLRYGIRKTGLFRNLGMFFLV